MEQVQKNSPILSSESHTLQIDLTQAEAQIEALGHKQNAVCVRAFLPKEDPRYAPNTGRKADKLDWKQIQHWQAQGYGIYIVVNGGGHKDGDITDCRAVFCEFDDRLIEDQINFWQELGLPEPSLQIATRKSVHTYWVFDKSITVAQWRELQTALLNYTGSDPALKNPSRVMRLAGAYHIKPGCEPLRCDVIHQSDKRYSYDTLRAVVPLLQPQPSSPPLLPLSQPASKPESHSITAKYQRYEDIQIPVVESVPLEVCLSKESRRLLESGMGDGGRNVNGAKLARDLIGTANHLQAIAQQFLGDPRRLLEDYASRCTHALDAKEVESIWKSALKDNPTPSCKPEGVEACIRGWYWKNHIKPNQDHHKHHAQKPDSRTNTGNTTPRRSVIESVTLRERITEIIGRNLSAADFTAALIGLSASSGRQLREITELATAIEVDLEIEDTRSDRAIEINRLQQIKQRSLTLDKYLPTELAEPMTLVADWMGAPPAAFLVALLPTVASLLDPATRVIVKECIGFIEHPIIYAGIVTESGQRKSPILNAITQALRKLQLEEDERYQKLKADYDTAKAKWDALSPDAKLAQSAPVAPSKPREYYIDKATMEAVDTIKQNQPTHGILWLKDELSGLMASYGEYKNGRGGDKESMLSGWNGRGVKKNLKGGERISLSSDAMSVLGAIQDAKLQKMMGDFNDDQGDWARFLWLLIPLKALKLPSDDTSFQLAMLEPLYRRLAKLSAAQYRFGTDAQRLYDNFHWRLEQRRVNEPRRGMRAALAKMEGYTARIALVLHIIWELVEGNDAPSALVPRERVLAAMKLTEFFLGQVELIHVEGAAATGNDLTPRLAAILDLAKQFGELTARKVQSAVSWLRTVAAAKIRHDFLELASLGYGVCMGNGNRLKFIPQAVGSADSAAHTADVIADSSNPTQSIENQAFVDLTVVSADSADVKRSLASNKDEETGEISEAFIPNYQHQHISSLVSNPELASTTANNNLSAPASAVKADSLDNQSDDNTLDGGVVTKTEPNLISSQPLCPERSDRANACEKTNFGNQPASKLSGTNGDEIANSVVGQSYADVSMPFTTQNASDCCESNTGISETELQSWLVRIATVQNASECMDCLDALHQLPQSATEYIWNSAETLLPRFWEVAKSEVIDEQKPHPGVGFSTKASAQQQPQQPQQPNGCDAIVTQPSTEKLEHSTTTKVKELIAGLWVRCRDGFSGHLGAMTGDGRWWVKSPETRTHDAESRLYAAGDIIPMPAS